MAGIRVLIVDDSVVARKMLTETFSSDPEIEVAGLASNGNIALQKIPQVSPDIITLDVEMPDLNGIETLKQIRALYPKLPVIMFSALTALASSATLDALALGANDYVTKPTQNDSPEKAIQQLRSDLIPKIKALINREGPRRIRHDPGQKKYRVSSDRIALVCIGVSTGGPNALDRVFRTLPAGLPAPILVVQHMPPLFTKTLAEKLTSVAAFPVWEAVDGQKLNNGEAYIAPGNFHMTVQRHGDHFFAALNQDMPENSCRPSVDVMFRSAVRAASADVLGIIMTGMGQDGMRGCEFIKQAGGRVLAQDEATSVIWGMPAAVVEAGLADSVVPLEKISYEIRRLLAGGVSAEKGALT